MARSQNFWFGFSDYCLADVGGVTLDTLHRDADALCRSFEQLELVAKRLGVLPPAPHLPGFAYPHVASLGAEIDFPPDSEPKPRPLLKCAADIDRLREPTDYLACELIQQRRELATQLKRRRPDAAVTIGHSFEGPVTTAALLLGQDFFTLPYDDPARAHKLMEFSVRSALNYCRAMYKHLGWTIEPRPAGFPDDFAGMFPPAQFEEFVAPYWEMFYQGLLATGRSLHSELLHPEHLKNLKQLRIDQFDPGGDQYLTPEILRAQCPTAFQLCLQPWETRDLPARDLQLLYRHRASFEPAVMALELNRLVEEPKMRAVLEVAWELKG